MKRNFSFQLESTNGLTSVLAETIESLLTQPKRLEELQSNATQLVLQQQGILAAYLLELQKSAQI